MWLATFFRSLLGVVLLDADADGDEDLFVSADGSTMFAQNEDGFSTLATVELEGAAPLFNTGDLAVGDLDGSPGEDVVVHGTFVLSSNADGSFSSIARLQTAGGHAAVGPFDDVGPSDIAIALLSDAPSGSGSIAIGLVAEGGVGDLVEALPACQWCVRDKPSAADVNADGAIDLVYPSLDGVGVLLGCGDGAFAEPLHIGMERTLFRVHVIDVDQDGRPDLVSSTVAPNGELVVARGLE